MIPGYILLSANKITDFDIVVLPTFNRPANFSAINGPSVGECYSLYTK